MVEDATHDVVLVVKLDHKKLEKSTFLQNLGVTNDSSLRRWKSVRFVYRNTIKMHKVYLFINIVILRLGDTVDGFGII